MRSPAFPHARQWLWALGVVALLGLLAVTAQRELPPELPPELIYTVVFGGSSSDQAVDIAADAAGNLYILGKTISPDFPTVSPAQPGFGGGICPETGLTGICADAVVVSLTPDGRTLRYSTYFGGSGYEQPAALAVAADGTVAIAGRTTSPDLPGRRPAALSPALRGTDDAFLAVLDPSGALVASGYLGGSGFDAANGLARGADGALYLIGDTSSDDFPTVAPLQPGHVGDAFVSTLSPDLGRIRFSTYLGGSELDYGSAIALGPDGAIYVSGTTSSSDFPTRTPIQAGLPPQATSAHFIAALEPDSGGLRFSTYLGGSQYGSSSESIAVSATGDVLVALGTYQTGWVAQLAPGGGAEVFRNQLGPTGTVAFDAAGQACAAISPWPYKSGFNYPPGVSRPPYPLLDQHIVVLDGAGQVRATFFVPSGLIDFATGPAGQLWLTGVLNPEEIDPAGTLWRRLSGGTNHTRSDDIYVAALRAGPGRQGWQWPPPAYTNQIDPGSPPSE